MTAGPGIADASVAPTDRPDLVSRLVIRFASPDGAPGGVDLPALRARIDRRALPAPLLRRGLAAVHDLHVDGDAGKLPARLYRPRRARGLVLFLHGGGFCLCGLDSHEDVACRLARASGATVLSLAYRLAPEYPFPAAPLDGFAAYRWLRRHAKRLGRGSASIAVAGDSAGANLAAAVCRIARERGMTLPAMQLLFYPPAAGREPVPSAREFGAGHLLTQPMIDWFRDQYLPTSDEARSDWYAPALAADGADLPPASIVTAGCDPLRDEGAMLAERFRAWGVPVRYAVVPGALHGFLNFAAFYPKGRRALRAGGAALRAALDAADASAHGLHPPRSGRNGGIRE